MDWACEAVSTVHVAKSEEARTFRVVGTVGNVIVSASARHCTRRKSETNCKVKSYGQNIRVRVKSGHRPRVFDVFRTGYIGYYILSCELISKEEKWSKLKGANPKLVGLCEIPEDATGVLGLPRHCPSRLVIVYFDED